MFLYENNKCPVCEKLFEQGDDVVVCPECGTPHHRVCYEASGRCANKKLHGTDFVYRREPATKEIKASKDKSFEDIFANADALSSNSREYKPQPAKFPQEKEQAAVSEEKKEQQAENSASQAVLMAAKAAGKEMFDKEIDGVKFSDAATVVGVNYPRWIKKFSKNRKIGWNWGAFFFGPLYFMFRKMYLESLIFITIPMVVNAAVNFFMKDAVKLLLDISTKASSFISSNEVAKGYEYLMNALTASENRSALYVIMLTSGLSVLLSIVSAVLADGLYRKRVVKIVKTVDEKISMGESFSLISAAPFLSGEEMSQQDMRKMFLAKQGGVSTFLPFMLFMLSVFMFLF